MEICYGDTLQARQKVCMLHVLCTYTLWLKQFQVTQFQTTNLEKLKNVK
jgi:hypothetical protein